MESKIYVETAFRNGRTLLNDVFFTVPYKIMQPFYNGSHSDIMLMAASAGLLKGDSLNAEYIFRSGSDVKIITQSYEKVMNTDGGFTSKNIKLTVEKDTAVSFMPNPIIPFADSDFRSETEINISDGARLFFCDIFSCGRTGMNNERFRMKRFSSRLRCKNNGRLVFADNTRIIPSALKYDALGMWGEYSHNGLAYVFLSDSKRESEYISAVRRLAEDYGACEIGISACIKGAAIRILANSGDEIYEFFKQAERLI